MGKTATLPWVMLATRTQCPLGSTLRWIGRWPLDGTELRRVRAPVAGLVADALAAPPPGPSEALVELTAQGEGGWGWSARNEGLSAGMVARCVCAPEAPSRRKIERPSARFGPVNVPT